MKHRSPAAVFLLSLITFGIYALVWEVKTKNELNRQGADIPTAWLLIVPLANLYWIWKYALGVEKVSNGKITAVLTLILMLLLSIVGMAIMQSEYNKLTLAPSGGVPEPATPPTTPISPTVTAATPSDPASTMPADTSPPAVIAPTAPSTEDDSSTPPTVISSDPPTTIPPSV